MFKTFNLNTPGKIMKNRLQILITILTMTLSLASLHAERKNERFTQNGPKLSDPAPDFNLSTWDGKNIQASMLWHEKPLLLVTGSYTCPVFREKVSPLQKVASEFKDRIHVIVLYVQEAHPKGDISPYSGREWVTPQNEREGILIPQPKSMEERVTHVRECVQRMNLTVPVVIDTMDNAVWSAYGSAPNCAYLINTDGKIVAQQGWFDSAKMSESISQLIGGSSKPK